MAELNQNLSSILNNAETSINEDIANDPVSDEEMSENVSNSNENFDLDKEALENELLETTGEIRNFDKNESKIVSNFLPFNIAQLPKIRHKPKITLETPPPPNFYHNPR